MALSSNSTAAQLALLFMSVVLPAAAVIPAATAMATTAPTTTSTTAPTTSSGQQVAGSNATPPVPAGADAGVAGSTGAVPPGLLNQVDISPQLTTSGQPTAEQLGNLAAQGYEAVIYLAPPTVGDAVKEEPLIVGKQGLVWINIPIRFGAPTDKDFETFAAVVNALGPRKILVHCQVNMRASSMVFLYRTLIRKEDPHKAYEAVTRIWVPDGPWKTLVQGQLKKHGVQFDPF